MFRLIGIAGLALVATASAALATDYSKVNCAAPKFMAYMTSRLPKLHSAANGANFTQRFSDQHVVGATTVSAVPAKIVCELTVELGVNGGATRTVHGRFTTTQQPGGGNHWQWLPGY
jgi:hypothetical protein